MNRLARFIPLLLIVLAPTVMLYPLWSNPVSAGEDDVIYYYPMRKLVGESLREGCWPMHNPLEATGVPLMADPQSAVMHPATWLFAVLDAKLAYSLSIFLAFSLAGGGAYRYLRRLGLVRLAATFGAVAFMFCGFMVAHRVHLSMVLTAAMLPWGLWGIERLRSGARGGIAVLAPTWFLALSAGHWPTLVHLALIWGVYLLLRARPLWRSLLAAGAAAAIALAIAAPQIHATGGLLAETTRRRIGYATAGENSFFPVASALALLPFLMGSRTPNFFHQRWWGPWHLCEMLGYVGLVTLVLAAAVVWRVYRKRGATEPAETDSAERNPTDGNPWALRKNRPAPIESLRPVVRVWTWIGVGAAVFMLGYYLPTYRLVHVLPVLGVVRCPARLVVAVDMALATLAATAIHVLSVGGAGSDVTAKLRRTVQRVATRALPIAIIATLTVLAGAAGVLILLGVWADRIPWPMNGGAWDILRAVTPTNPGVWVPLILCAATIVVVRYWLRRPGSRSAMLVALLMADLFFLTRFVDVPAAGSPVSDPDASPAARWLAENAPNDQPCRVWGMSDSYHARATELLLAKTCTSMGFATISNYGPFQSPAHVQLLGFRIFGTNRDWRRLVRENRLLSCYGVRYLITADPERREVIESVRVPAGPPPPVGENLSAGPWELSHAELLDGVLRFSAPSVWRSALATKRVRLRPGMVYRISLDVRAPQGAAGYLRAEIVEKLLGPADFDADPLALMAYPEQIGPQWRRFEWTFRTPGRVPETVTFRVLATGERPIEARGISLRRSHWPRPAGAANVLPPGERVYSKVAELPAVDPADSPVAIYENRLFLPAGSLRRVRAAPEQIETFKWRPEEHLRRYGNVIPDLSLGEPARPPAPVWILVGLGLLAYGILLVAPAFRR